MNKKLSLFILVLCALIGLTVMPAFAETGSTQWNLPFWILFGVLTPVMIGFIVFYAISAKKYKKTDSKSVKKINKVIRIEDEQD